MPSPKSCFARHSVTALALAVLPFTFACSNTDGEGHKGPGVTDPPDAMDPGPDEHVVTVDDGFLAVWGNAPDDVWAAGINGVMAHYDGESWKLTEAVTEHNILAICGSSSTDIWASGDDVILRYDGTSWTVVMQDLYEQLPGIACRGPDDVFMAGIATDLGAAVLRHWDGSGFDYTIPGGVRSFWDVWSSASGVVWVGGSATDGTGILARGQGTEFDLVAEYSGDSLRAIWGSSDDDLWISPYAGPFEHWDGAAFVHEFGASPATILGMSGTARDDAWAVGLEGTILHFDGESWTPSESGIKTNLTSIWAAAADDVWAAGSKGLLLHFDGESWSHIDIVDGL